VADLGPDVHGFAVDVEQDLRLGQVEVQAAPGRAPGVHLARQLLCQLEHRQHGLQNATLQRVLLQESAVDLGVGQPGVALDDGVGKGPVLGRAVCVEGDLGDHGQAGNIGVQAAQAVGQGLREHGLDRGREVVGVGPLARLLVQGAAHAHVVGDVGDGHPQAVARSVALDIDGVVEIPGLGPVDGHEGQVAQVLAALEVVLAGQRGQKLGLVQDLGREVQGNLVVGLDQLLLHGDVGLAAEHLLDAPAPQVAVDLLAGHDEDHVLYRRAIGPGLDHEARALAGVGGLAEQVALGQALTHPGRDPASAALEDARDAAFVAASGPLAGDRGHHPVAVPGVAHVPGADEHVLAALVLGNDEAHAGALDLEDAGDEAHALGQAPGVLGLDQLALLHQFVEHGKKRLALAFVHV